MARPLVTTLTAAHRRIAEAAAKLERLRPAGRPVFVPDLVKALGYSDQGGLLPTLRVMARNGYVELFGSVDGGRRTQVVRLTAKARQAMGAGGVRGAGGGLPLLGSIPAGLLSEAVGQAEEVMDPAEVLPWRPGDFLLRVRGDSMTGDGILDGDLVLLRPGGERIRSGTIAAVCVDDGREATLKRVYFEGDQVRLRAANPAFPDVVVPAESVRIAGVFRGLVRHGGGPA